MLLFRNILVQLMLVLALCATCKQKEAASETAHDPVKTAVAIVQPVQQSLTDFLELNANTVFKRKVVIRTNITGYIIDMPWKVGDRINPGASFCFIKTKEQDALKSIDQRESSLKQFQQPIRIASSAAGFITSVNYIRGDFVNEGDILATITEPSSLVLTVNVPYEYHQYVYNGRTCEVKLPDGRKMNASISMSIPVIDSPSQTQQYFIHLPIHLQLPENMNVLVRIPMRQKLNALCLPLDAIQTNETQSEFWVMKLVNDSLAVRVPIIVGLQNDSLKEVITGVTIHDRIITQGGYGLGDSSLVGIMK